MKRRAVGAPVWVPAGFFHLRTPLLPFDEFLAFGGGLTASSASSDTVLDAAIVHDRAALGVRLREWLSRPAVREALYIASPALDEQIDRLVADPCGDSDAKIDVTLYKYLARMSGRSTPFGLFAGCSLGAIAAAHHLELGPGESYRRLTELDSGYAAALGDALARTLGDSVIVRPNASLYAAAGRLRYFAAEQRPAGPTFRMEALTTDVPLEAALARARDGATLFDIVGAVTSAVAGVSTADVEHYVHDLHARNILVADLEPALTGQRPLDDLIAQLGHYAGAKDSRERLVAVRAEIVDIDAAPL